MSETLEYDVFLSYHSKGKGITYAIAECMTKNKLRVWLDVWVIQPEDLITRIDMYEG